MEEDKNLKFDVALKSAMLAKNTLVNVYGYSPLQLVTGKQPRLPGVSNDNLAAMGEESEETRGISRISALQQARKAFMEVENSVRLKKALAARPYKKEIYQVGENVFFKYGTDKKWHGPGRIIAVDNKIIYIKYGRVIIHTSEPRVTKTADGSNKEQEQLSAPPHITARKKTGLSGLSARNQNNQEADSDDDDIDIEDNGTADPDAVPADQDALEAAHESVEAVGDAQHEAHANEDTETNGYQPFNDQEAWHHSFSSNRGLDQSGQELDNSDNDQEQFPEDSFLRMGRFRTRKPGKKAMIPRKDAMIFARNKGSDLWYL